MIILNFFIFKNIMIKIELCKYIKGKDAGSNPQHLIDSFLKDELQSLEHHENIRVAKQSRGAKKLA